MNLHQERHGTARAAGLAALGLILMTLLGCQTAATRVVPAASEIHKALAADDIVLMMRQAGFSDADILKRGTDIRNALATHGTARVETNDVVRAIFYAQKDTIYVTTNTGKAFFYQIRPESKSDSQTQDSRTGPA
jgi:hypothetical protein